MSDVVTVVATIRARPGQGDALEAILGEQVLAVRAAEPECLLYRLHRSATDPDLFLFYEQYASRSALEAHQQAPHLAAFRTRRADLIAGPAEVGLYRAVAD